MASELVLNNFVLYTHEPEKQNDHQMKRFPINIISIKSLFISICLASLYFQLESLVPVKLVNLKEFLTKDGSILNVSFNSNLFLL
jgi:hypothetical protein